MINLLALIVTICIVIWTVYLVMMGRMTMTYTKTYEKMMKDLTSSFDKIVQEDTEETE